MKKVDGKNINEFVRKVKAMQKKGFVMVGQPITNGSEYHCIMTEDLKSKINRE